MAIKQAFDTLVLDVSEDAYKGNAQYVVFVDGVQAGGRRTATASHAAGADNAVTITGSFGAGLHTVSVEFLNDLYGGSSTADRNLYLDGITYNGVTQPVNAALMTTGATSKTVVGGQARDTLVLNVSDTYYQGDAQFTVKVDGKQVGGTYTASGNHYAGQSSDVTLMGNWGSGPHTVVATFTNDLSGPAGDRNLYINSATYDGILTAVGASLFSTGDKANFTVGAPVTTPAPAAPVTPASPASALVLNVAEDAYQGNAQFTVTVDGKQAGGVYTATAAHQGQLSSDITIPGSWTAGTHDVGVTFVNDANGPAGDRNLYVNYASFGGNLTSVNANLFSTGDTARFSVSTPTHTLNPGLQLLGVNLSGAEFGTSLGPAYATNPKTGTDGTDYTFPTHAEIDAYASEGLNIIRLPLEWERLQPVQNGPLDATYLGQIENLVSYAASKGVDVDLDIHNYGYGYGNLVGSAGTPDSSFANLWSQIATHFVGQSNVLFGLMNEPSVQTPAQWLQAVNPAIAAIRAAGATQEILVPGTFHENGASYVSQGNASVFAGNVVDPGHNMAFEIHQYNDADQSGGDTSVVSPTIGADRLVAVTAWAEQTGNRLFLGEFGAGSDPASLLAMKNQLAFIQAHSDVWQGGTEWGGGPWWPQGYGFSTEPVNGAASPQVSVLQQFVPHAA